tara:strand:+ start:1148 stop:1879 length:732 start_codon:yes stop_codon:yes gene_type:complete
MKKMIALLLVTTMLAGCTESIPDPVDFFDDCTEPDWETESGTIVVLENDTYSPISIGNETKWLELRSFTYTATHLSFEVVNNSVIFNNLTFDSVGGYLYVDNSISKTETFTVYTYELLNTSSNETYDISAEYALELSTSWVYHDHTYNNDTSVNSTGLLTRTISFEEDIILDTNVTIESGSYSLVSTPHNVSLTFTDSDFHRFDSGYAPSMGLVMLDIPEFNFDITIEYTIEYRLLTGQECLE